MTKKVIETVYGWYIENPKQKVELDDIVGLVKTDEPTDSTEKRFTVKRFIEDYKSQIIDNEGKIETLSEFVDYLNNLHEENQKLKEEIHKLKSQ